jgi:hypothetical protein
VCGAQHVQELAGIPGPGLGTTRTSWRAMTDPIPPVPMIAVVMSGTSSASRY